MYVSGKGAVRRNDKEAAKWYLRAAEQGSVKAQLGIAILYESGKGVKKSKEEAIRWYRLAAAQGEQMAQSALAELEEK